MIIQVLRNHKKQGQISKNIKVGEFILNLTGHRITVDETEIVTEVETESEIVGEIVGNTIVYVGWVERVFVSRDPVQEIETDEEYEDY